MSPFADWFARGGIIMWILSGLAVILYGLILERVILLFGPATRTERREGELSRLLTRPIEETARSLDVVHMAEHATRIALAEYPELTRGLALIRALVAAAPLLGLLGTVMGMITTFEGILLGERATLVGAGISRALLTTQYGLAIAVPGLLMERILSRRSEKIALERAQIAAGVIRDRAQEIEREVRA